MSKKIIPPRSIKHVPKTAITQMLSLATSGFGLVAALAWNEVVKETVNLHIKPYFPKGSGLLSLLIYAVVITIIAVTVTLQLTFLSQKISGDSQKEE